MKVVRMMEMANYSLDILGLLYTCSPDLPSSNFERLVPSPQYSIIMLFLSHRSVGDVLAGDGVVPDTYSGWHLRTVNKGAALLLHRIPLM